MALNFLKISKFSRFITTLAFVVLVHALLILHLAVCSHKLAAYESYEVVALNISIEPQLAGGKGGGPLLPENGKTIVDSAILDAASNAVAQAAVENTEPAAIKSSDLKEAKLGVGNSKFNVLPVNFSPKFLHYQPPVYPMAAKRMKQQGVVVVDVKLDAEYGQGPATLYSSSGYNLLDNAAIEAANNSVLASAFEFDGGAVDHAYIARIKYQFQLMRK